MRSASGFQPTLPARGATARRGQRGCQSPFQPTLPARGATEIIFQHPGRKKFQPTLPARGATIIGADFFAVLAHFNPRSPHGERRAGASRVRARAVVISTHAPRTGSDIPDADYSLQRVCISTHAPRTGSDGRVACAGARGSDFNPRSPHGERRFSPFSIRSTMSFQPTLPARGATSVRLSTMQASSRFQPTLPARGATWMDNDYDRHPEFQPTLPARGATPATPGRPASLPISTHAPRTGSDPPRRLRGQKEVIFQPTLPARGATRALRRGHLRVCHFNPRSPHGERPAPERIFLRSGAGFQPTLPARGATLDFFRR